MVPCCGSWQTWITRSLQVFDPGKSRRSPDARGGVSVAAGSLHGSARATPRFRAEFQASKDTTGTLARRYGPNRTTVTKWRQATMKLIAPHSTVLCSKERPSWPGPAPRPLLLLDNLPGCPRDSTPKLTRSSVHRCLERNGISRLPDNPDKASRRGKFAKTAIGSVHMHFSKLHLAESKPDILFAIDRVSKFACLVRENRHGCATHRGSDGARADVGQGFGNVVPPLRSDMPSTMVVAIRDFVAKCLDASFFSIHPGRYRAASPLQKQFQATTPCTNQTLVDAGRFVFCCPAALPTAAGATARRFDAGTETRHIRTGRREPSALPQTRLVTRQGHPP